MLQRLNARLRDELNCDTGSRLDRPIMAAALTLGLFAFGGMTGVLVGATVASGASWLGTALVAAPCVAGGLGAGAALFYLALGPEPAPAERCPDPAPAG